MRWFIAFPWLPHECFCFLCFLCLEGGRWNWSGWGLGLCQSWRSSIFWMMVLLGWSIPVWWILLIFQQSWVHPSSLWYLSSYSQVSSPLTWAQVTYPWLLRSNGRHPQSSYLRMSFFMQAGRDRCWLTPSLRCRPARLLWYSWKTTICLCSYWSWAGSLTWQPVSWVAWWLAWKLPAPAGPSASPGWSYHQVGRSCWAHPQSWSGSTAVPILSPWNSSPTCFPRVWNRGDWSTRLMSRSVLSFVGIPFIIWKNVNQ